MSSAGELDLLRSTVDGIFGEGAPDLETLGELGLLGLLVPEARGGGGWCPVEATVVADRIGRGVYKGGAETPGAVGSVAPWLGASVAASALAMLQGTDDQLTRLLQGDEVVVAATGQLEVEDGAATGCLVGVERAEEARSLVVLGDDSSVVVVELAPEHTTFRPEPTSIDTTRSVWRVELTGAPATEVGRVPSLHDAARMLAAATSLGSLRAALGRLVPYLSDRVAFGAPIASFQAVQHRIVDLFLLEVRAGVAVDAAARALVADPVGGSWLASVAHAFVAERIAPALDECIQLTGGIGFTWEHPLHHELRRSVADGVSFGSARESREHLIGSMGWA